MKIIRNYSLDRLTVYIYQNRETLVRGDNPILDPVLNEVFKSLGMSEENRKKKKDGTPSNETVYFHRGIKVYRSFEKIEIDFSGEFFILNPDPSIMIHNFFQSVKPIQEKVNIFRIDGCRDFEGISFKKIFPANLKIRGFNNPAKVKHSSVSPYSPIVGNVIRNGNISFVVYDKTYNINQVESEKNTAYKQLFGERKITRCEIQYLDKNKNNRLFKSLLFENENLEDIAEKIFKDFYRIHPAVNDKNEIRDCYFNKILKPYRRIKL